MKALLTTAVLGAALLAVQAPAALATNAFLTGHVYCADTGLPLGNATVVATDNADFAAAGTTDATGFYSIMLPIPPGTYTATANPMGGTIITPPASGTLCANP